MHVTTIKTLTLIWGSLSPAQAQGQQCQIKAMASSIVKANAMVPHKRLRGSAVNAHTGTQSTTGILPLSPFPIPFESLQFPRGQAGSS